MRGRSKELRWGTALEAPDPAALAGFYSTLLDWPVVHVERGQAIVKPPQDSVYMSSSSLRTTCRRFGPPPPVRSAR